MVGAAPGDIAVKSSWFVAFVFASIGSLSDGHDDAALLGSFPLPTVPLLLPPMPSELKNEPNAFPSAEPVSAAALLRFCVSDVDALHAAAPA